MERIGPSVVQGAGWRRWLSEAGFYGAVIALVSPALLLFLWMLSLSLKNELDNTSFPPVFIPNPPTMANYVDVIEKNKFLSYLWNSIVVTGGATLIGLLLGVPAGYGIAKSKAHGVAVLILIARMTPALSYLIPLFILFQTIGVWADDFIEPWAGPTVAQFFHLSGSLKGLVITHLVITIPIIVWVMIGYFESLPQDLDDAALIDGCTLWQAFRHIALPLAKPGIFVGAILSFIFSWNNFIFAVVLGGKESRTLPYAVYNSLTFEQISWGPLAAAALLVTAPVLLVTVLAQKQIVAGLTAGGLKDG